MINGIDSVRPSMDTLYRLVASLMGLASLFVFFRWAQAPSPIIALGQAGAWVGLPNAAEVAGGISSWFTSRTSLVRPLAELLLVLGVTFNSGAGINGPLSLGRFRGGSSAVLAIGLLHEVSPEILPSIWFAGLITLVLLVGFIASHPLLGRLGIRDAEATASSLSSWLTITAANLIIALFFVFFLLMWLISETPSHRSKN